MINPITITFAIRFTGVGTPDGLCTPGGILVENEVLLTLITCFVKFKCGDLFRRVELLWKMTNFVLVKKCWTVESYILQIST